jgi:hypothetical protein
MKVDQINLSQTFAMMKISFIFCDFFSAKHPVLIPIPKKFHFMTSRILASLKIELQPYKLLKKDVIK